MTDAPTPQKADPKTAIAFQGMAGAYSDLACREAYPDYSPVPCPSFEDTFAAVGERAARLAMIPIDNSVAGRVADIHHLLPDSGLHIVAEHFQRVNHHLLAPKGATIETVKQVHSHVHALGQCRRLIADLGFEPVVRADTAGAAAEVAARGDPSVAAIASSLAGEIYGLESLRADIEDNEHNTTRFIVMAREPAPTRPGEGALITSFVFRVRSVPAALYKALGGFATNGINLTKLESYLVGERFQVAQFHADVDGHPDEPSHKLAFEELGFFSEEVRILGTYPAHKFRQAETSD